MQAVFSYLKSSGIDATLSYEKIFNQMGMGIFEPVISLSGNNVNRISVYPLVGTQCTAAGNTTRFHYLVDCDKDFSEDLVESMRTATRMSPKGPEWVGHELADILNKDKDISQAILKCEKSIENIDFQIEAASSHEVYILGSKLTDSWRFAPLFSSNRPADIDLNCILGLKIAEKAAEHVRKLVNTQ